MKLRKLYRPCAVAVVINSKGQVLAGERQDLPGVWQCPQGGIDEGESSKDAVVRELYEESSLKDVKILDQTTQTVLYDFPDEINSAISKKWRGQSLTAFLIKIKTGEPSAEKAPDKEFSKFKWVSPSELLEHITPWKKAAFQQIFSQLKLR